MSDKDEKNAQHFVENLLTEGVKVNCDDTIEEFNDTEKLPDFYDEALYKRGQKFFYKHISALFFGKGQGLLAVLLVPTILKILILTKMSSTCMTAYKRYVATTFHIMVWYDSDFKSGSKLWKSIADVKSRHNSASKRGCASGIHRISQADMALTQFGFMGFALTRSNLLGIFNATEEEWKAYVHVWRVIGSIMGVQDRFNICRESLEETREICNILIDRVYRPRLEERDKDFLEMSNYLINGLWAFNPMYHYEIFLCYLDVLLQSNEKRVTNAPTYFKLNFMQKIGYYFIIGSIALLRYNWFRIYRNYNIIVSLWLMKVFPFLGIYKFGKENAYVKIVTMDDKKEK